MIDFKRLPSEGFIMEVLPTNVLCREKELGDIRLFIDGRLGVPVHSIIVFGDTGTGKTFSIKHLLQNVRHVYINCIEMLQAKSVFSSILNQLNYKSGLRTLEEYANLLICDNRADFVQHFRQLTSDDQDEPIYLVFDDAQRLREMDLIAFFTRFQEISRRQVCSIFLTSTLPSHLISGTDYYPAHEIYFANYSHDQLCAVLVETRPEGSDKVVYEAYVRLVMSVFKNVTTNVRELMHIATSNFHHYMSPYLESSGEEPVSSLKLWKNIEPHLKNAMSTVYLRDSESQKGVNSSSDDKCMPTSKQIIELPFFSKFLLIAAYLASYNPPSTDKKFFVKKSNRERRKPNHFRRDKPNYHLLGPRPFPMNRMLAIFHAIIGTPVQPTVVLFSQISSLVHHKLITQAVALKDPLNNPRFKCSVDLDYVTAIANTVKFPVVQHLEDFNM